MPSRVTTEARAFIYLSILLKKKKKNPPHIWKFLEEFLQEYCQNFLEEFLFWVVTQESASIFSRYSCMNFSRSFFWNISKDLFKKKKSNSKTKKITKNLLEIYLEILLEYSFRKSKKSQVGNKFFSGSSRFYSIYSRIP